MSDDWHAMFLAVLDWLDDEAVRLELETAALIEVTQKRNEVTSAPPLSRIASSMARTINR